MSSYNFPPCNGGGGGDFPIESLDPATDLIATINEPTEVELTWTDNSGGCAYEINIDNVLVATTAPGATSYIATGLIPGVEYAFSIRAIQDEDVSVYVSVSVITTYEYGYPAGNGGGVQSDVVAQWIFDEASGDVIDQVGTVDLAPTQVGASSYIQREVSIGYTKSWESVSPGIFVLNRTSNSWIFYSADTSLAVGTGDATFEWISQYIPMNNGQSYATLYYSCNNSVLQGVYFYYDNATTTPRFNFYIKASDGSTLISTLTLVTNPFDFNIHKHRVVFDRAGDAEYFIDGVSQGTASMAGLVGKTLPCSQLILMGATTSAVNTLAGTLFEFRQSANATNNSGGPNGG